MTFRTTPRTVLALAAIALLVATGPADLTAQQDRVRVAVVDFANNSTFTYWGPRLGAAAADQIAGELIRSGEFSVIERSQLEAVLAEQSLGQTGAVDASTAARLGELLGVQALLTGSVTQFSLERRSGGFGPARATFAEAESVLDTRLIDTSTGEILLAVEGAGKKRMGGGAFKNVDFTQNFDAGVAQEALRPAVEETVRRIVEGRSGLASLAPPPSPPGMVVGSRESSIYIDRGAGHEVAAGHRYDVYRVVDEVRSADGELLDTITEKVGVLEVTRVLSSSSICRLVEGEATEGDVVRRQS